MCCLEIHQPSLFSVLQTALLHDAFTQMVRFFLKHSPGRPSHKDSSKFRVRPAHVVHSLEALHSGLSFIRSFNRISPVQTGSWAYQCLHCDKQALKSFHFQHQCDFGILAIETLIITRQTKVQL